MALESRLFRANAALQAAARRESARIVLGASGVHVRKVQSVLVYVDHARIAQDGIYGPATAAAVLAYKRKRRLGEPRATDGSVDASTLAAMDREMIERERTLRTSGVGCDFGTRRHLRRRV